MADKNSFIKKDALIVLFLGLLFALILFWLSNKLRPTIQSITVSKVPSQKTQTTDTNLLPKPSPTSIPQTFTYVDIDNLLSQIRKISPVKFGSLTKELKWQELNYLPAESGLTKPYYIPGHGMEAEINTTGYTDFLAPYLTEHGFTHIYDRQLPVSPAVLGLNYWYMKDNMLCIADEGYGKMHSYNSDGSDKHYSEITCGILPP